MFNEYREYDVDLTHVTGVPLARPDDGGTEVSVLLPRPGEDVTGLATRYGSLTR